MTARNIWPYKTAFGAADRALAAAERNTGSAGTRANLDTRS
jgi:hypothetical protein